MRIPISIKALSIAAALALLPACSNGSAIAPKPFTARDQARSIMGRIPIALSPIGLLAFNLNSERHFTSFDACPSSGPIEYLGDPINRVITIYSGKFASQAPCGQIAGNANWSGMFVNGSTHDLYVAGYGSYDIKVFHRGATTPFMTYTDPTDPTGQYTYDVTVARDGTVIASNVFSVHGEAGSISTWHSDGTFVGNFPMPNSGTGSYVTVQKNGTLYYNDTDLSSNAGLLWTGRCPHGACGKFTSTGATTKAPGGLRSADGQDLLQIDILAPGGGALITYESFETFPLGTSCAMGGVKPFTMDLSRTQHHLFYADPFADGGGEIEFPSCAPIGTVSGNPGGFPIGIAVDPPDGL
jgi:hypothetical protein